MKYSKMIFPMLSLLALASCGGSGGGSSSSPGGNDHPRQEMQVTEGTYKAILRPYNFTVAGWIPNGMADIKIVGNDIEVKSWMDDSSNVVHMQNIHVGTQCPTAANDSNGDGFVDFNESMTVAKDIFLPLDADLNSQAAGTNIYPTGNFTYFQKASLADMMSDLKVQHLNLEGRVIIVTGTAANRALPATVSAYNGKTRELSVPIACGVIERMPEVAIVRN